MIQAFEYFATSRTLYKRLRDDFKLPSITTLTRLTSKVNNVGDNSFIDSVFSRLNDCQKSYVLLIDEVYVKSTLTFHGGTLFGSSVNKPDQLASTVLAFMVVCLFGGPKFLVKMLPVCKLDSDFLYSQTIALKNQIKNAGGNMIAIVCDDNRVNQAFFKQFNCVSPWRTHEDIFLLFDYVHLMKSVRNNWLTEKTGEIEFSEKNDRYVAKWEDIKKLKKEMLSKF